MKQHIWAVVAMLVLAALACGQPNIGEKVDVRESTPSPTPGVQTYAVGDVIEVQSHTIVLNSVEVQGDRIKANFTIENKGSDEIRVSSLTNFEAKADDGTKLVEAFGGDCSPTIGGSVLSGDKLRGPICCQKASASACNSRYHAARPRWL